MFVYYADCGYLNCSHIANVVIIECSLCCVVLSVEFILSHKLVYKHMTSEYAPTVRLLKCKPYTNDMKDVGYGSKIQIVSKNIHSPLLLLEIVI